MLFLSRCLLILCFLGSLSTASAQKGWELGLNVGVANYFGDLNTEYSFKEAGLAGGFMARYNFNTRIALRIDGNYARIGGDDANSSNNFELARNLSFFSDVYDGEMALEFNFLNYVHGSRDEFFTPYLFAGFAVVNFDPKTDFEGDVVFLQPLGTEGQFRGEEYSRTQGAFAFGGGMKVDLSYRWSLNFELSARRMFTDYIDDVSTVYADTEDIRNLRGDMAADLSDRSILIQGVNENLIGQPGRQRGDSTGNDTYASFKVGLLYYFGELRCPEYGSRRRR